MNEELNVYVGRPGAVTEFVGTLKLKVSPGDERTIEDLKKRNQMLVNESWQKASENTMLREEIRSLNQNISSLSAELHAANRLRVQAEEKIRKIDDIISPF